MTDFALIDLVELLHYAPVLSKFSDIYLPHEPTVSLMYSQSMR